MHAIDDYKAETLKETCLRESDRLNNLFCKICNHLSTIVNSLGNTAAKAC